MNNWHVITGGPCSGKTTTIDILKKRGFTVSEEVARKYFESEIEKGNSNEEIRKDPQKLQDSIARLQVDFEKDLDPKTTIFLDRALPDSFAYYNFLKIKIPSWYKTAYANSTYNKVFFLERLPMKKDEVRIESDDEAQVISDAIVSSYKNVNSQLIRVPVMDREERIDFILKNINF